MICTLYISHLYMYLHTYLYTYLYITYTCICINTHISYDIISINYTAKIDGKNNKVQGFLGGPVQGAQFPSLVRKLLLDPT